MIALRGVRIVYGDHVVLDDVDVELRAGEITGILGRGGAGKTTLLKVVCTLVRPLRGEVWVDETETTSLHGAALAAVRARFGVLFQNNALFDFMTVEENVRFPLERAGQLDAEAIALRARQRLRDVGLEHAAGLYPRELSGGMRKRASLARATIAEPPIVVYDDPTAGLDPVTSSKIFDLVARLHRAGATTLVAGHDVDRMRKVCDRFLLIEDGRIRFDGTAEAGESSDDPVVRLFFCSQRGRAA